jgi:hypothetical protein
MNRLPNRVYNSSNVFGFALDGIPVAITALTPTTPIDSIHAKVLLKRGKDGYPTCGSTTRTMDQDERRPCTAPIVGDRGTVS